MLEEGRIIHGKWEILGFIAKGGKGEVYMAKQLSLDRRVALKIMSREFIESLEGDEEEITSELERFRREVRIMAQMRHPNVIQVFDFDRVDVNGNSLDYIVMEYIPGPTLRQTMPDEGFGDDTAGLIRWIETYFQPVLEGMEAVHAKGVIHRDMKPANVLIDDEAPKIADFGLAGGHNLGELTRSHHIIGTMPYMPEEQFLDLTETDARADVYALGKILYEAADGRMTKEKNKPFEQVSLSNTDTSFKKRLNQIILNATAKDRNARTSTVRAMHDAILDLLNRERTVGHEYEIRKQKEKQKRTVVIASILALLAIIFFAQHYFFMSSNDEPAPQSAEPSPEIPEPRQPDTFRDLAESMEFENPRPTKIVRSADGELPEQLVASDGMTMHLLPGGVIDADPTGPGGEASTIGPYYMDETPVTNHLYVEFLNRIPDLEMDEGAVGRGGMIWLVLGEVRPGYEPIIHQDGEFLVKSEMVANPVVRVTPAGAIAYAKFHGRSLPTMAQWQLAALAEDKRDSSALPSWLRPGGQAFAAMMDHGLSSGQESSATSQAGNEADKSGEEHAEGWIHPISESRPNAFGIRGLGANVNEWTVVRNGDRVHFHIHGHVGNLELGDIYLERRPWEAFIRVGFRTVLAATQ